MIPGLRTWRGSADLTAINIWWWMTTYYFFNKKNLPFCKGSVCGALNHLGTSYQHHITMHRVTYHHYFYPKEGNFFRMLDGKWKCIKKNKQGLRSCLAPDAPEAALTASSLQGRDSTSFIYDRCRTEHLPVRLDGCCQTLNISISLSDCSGMQTRESFSFPSLFFLFPAAPSQCCLFLRH